MELTPKSEQKSQPAIYLMFEEYKNDKESLNLYVAAQRKKGKEVIVIDINRQDFNNEGEFIGIQNKDSSRFTALVAAKPGTKFKIVGHGKKGKDHLGQFSSKQIAAVLKTANSLSVSRKDITSGNDSLKDHQARISVITCYGAAKNGENRSFCYRLFDELYNKDNEKIYPYLIKGTEKAIFLINSTRAGKNKYILTRGEYIATVMMSLILWITDRRPRKILITLTVISLIALIGSIGSVQAHVFAILLKTTISLAVIPVGMYVLHHITDYVYKKYIASHFTTERTDVDKKIVLMPEKLDDGYFIPLETHPHAARTPLIAESSYQADEVKAKHSWNTLIPQLGGPKHDDSDQHSENSELQKTEKKQDNQVSRDQNTEEQLIDTIDVIKYGATTGK